jgi:hypothetical protein
MAVLGIGMVGLLVWRLSQPKPAPVAPAPVSVPVPSSRYVEPLDIPPPPELPDAAPDTGPAKPAPTAWVGEGCNAASCSGRITTDLNSALSFRAKTAHKCYEEALGQDPSLKGQVVIGVRVAYDGNICSASVESNDLANAGVAACIAKKFRQGARLPSPTGGCLDVNIPMKLLPAK